jgi:glucose-1-phosphate cytidylyltransferase
VTLTSVQPVARFGALGLNNTQIYSFQEKPRMRADGSTADSSC